MDFVRKLPGFRFGFRQEASRISLWISLDFVRKLPRFRRAELGEGGVPPSWGGSALLWHGLGGLKGP